MLCNLELPKSLLNETSRDVCALVNIYQVTSEFNLVREQKEYRCLCRVPIIVLNASTDLVKLNIRSNENPSSFFLSFFLWRRNSTRA